MYLSTGALCGSYPMAFTYQPLLLSEREEEEEEEEEGESD